MQYGRLCSGSSLSASGMLVNGDNRAEFQHVNQSVTVSTKGKSVVNSAL